MTFVLLHPSGTPGFSSPTAAPEGNRLRFVPALERTRAIHSGFHATLPAAPKSNCKTPHFSSTLEIVRNCSFFRTSLLIPAGLKGARSEGLEHVYFPSRVVHFILPQGTWTARKKFPACHEFYNLAPRFCRLLRPGWARTFLRCCRASLILCTFVTYVLNRFKRHSLWTIGVPVNRTLRSIIPPAQPFVQPSLVRFQNQRLC